MKKRILAVGFILAMFVGVGLSLMPEKSEAISNKLYMEKGQTCTCPWQGADCLVDDEVQL